ncbi:MAG TPA: hypothetical protein PLP17_14075 [Oligoflexia bacterium]|nr:hypothetical protein [Oligoflexia bacterium]
MDLYSFRSLEDSPKGHKPSFAAHLGLLLAALMLVAGAAPGQSSAEQQHLLVLNELPAQQGGIYAQLESGDAFSFIAAGGSSYCCTIFADKDPAARFGNVQAENNVSLNVCERGLAEPMLAASRGRICMSLHDEQVSLAKVVLTVLFGEDGRANASNIRLSCEETTLFGGFNTQAVSDNFLEITNTLHRDKEIEGVVSVTDEIGHRRAVKGLSVAAGRRMDVNIHDLVGASGHGPVKLRHNGPPGSVRAVLTHYAVVSANPLELRPVLQQELRTRAQMR